MKFKSEFSNAITLFFLLRLLFWSFTWNLTEDFDFSSKHHGFRKLSKDVGSTVRGDVTVFKNQFSAFLESFSSVKFEKREPNRLGSSSDSIIPSFNEWKEKEFIKNEKGSSKEKTSAHPSKHLHRRKLNYASAKCGAKVLGSNPESRHRSAVLSDRSDEYMLNPCRVKTWFIVELCDTVEATQVEIANYELYSSSPKEFSVFWSDVYPTPAWHLLGTFEAKDTRTMQTFDLTAKNFGKFIKVIIYNHHGKEHYCPLSVLRIVGYSMVQKLEAVEQEGTISDSVSDSGFQEQNETDFLPQNESQFEINVSKEHNYTSGIHIDTSYVHSSISFKKICSLYFIHCSNATDKKVCMNKPTCFFVAEILRESGDLCKVKICSKSPASPSNASYAVRNKNASDDILPKRIAPGTEKYDSEQVSTRNLENHSKYPDAGDLKMAIEEINGYDTGVRNGKYTTFTNATQENSEDANVSVSAVNVSVADKQVDEADSKDTVRLTDSAAIEKCVCENDQGNRKVKLMERALDGETSSQELIENDDGIDSAGLIQKESVLFKLTVRIKTLETDLSMINKYLQELSQSYREQIENMKSSFDRTVMAIRITTEKSTTIDKRQEESISILQNRLKILNQKTEYLLNGQKDLVKKVLEWHGFFLLLEIIIISTIFSVFMNIFYRKSASIEYKNNKLSTKANRC